MSDKRIVHIVSFSAIAALLISFLFGDGGRIAAAILMACICAVTLIFIKKRSIPSFLYSEIIMVMGVIAAVWVMLYYLTGLEFGFAKANYGTPMDVIFQYILPISVIIVSSELVRCVLRAQESKLVDVLAYLSCVVAEVLVHYVWSDILNFKKFMDIIALVLLPAIIANLLYHYLARRYGALPNVVYRLIITLYPYVISYGTGIPNSLLAFANLLFPLAIYLFIDYLYEKKKRYALRRVSKIGVVISMILLVCMTLLIMLVSNTFRYGAYVIATESMTGELNKGDVAIYEQYDDQTVQEGQVIVFNKNNNKVIHRVVDIENINGQNRYYTKGDANEDLDYGYITEGDIVGVVGLKLPYFGYPTLWLRAWVQNELK